MGNINEYSASEGLSLSLGQVGNAIESGSGSAGLFVAIQFIEDSTITTLTPEDSTWISESDTGGVTFPNGTVIFGRWTAVTLATGTAVLYKG
jgi:hypothetical protein|tara:strand:+ start:293 stop:568 length:276 start_codon:yes stop_codon:yes gene_type:complete